MSTFAVFLSLYFFVLFLYTFTTTIHLWPFMRKIFLCTSIFSYMTNFFCTRIGTLSLYVTRSIYKLYLHSKIFHFSQHTLMVHTKVSSYTLVAHTHKDSFPRIIYTQRPSIHTFLLHTCINKNLFLFFMNMTFIHSASFFLLGFLARFILLFLGRRS